MATTLRVLAPFAGPVHRTADVPDAVFSQDIMGTGLAVEPDETVVELCAPVEGTLTTVWPHAVILTPPGLPPGAGLLLHMGINTVHLRGDGFETLAHKDETVVAGQVLARWDTSLPRERELSLLTPVVLIHPEEPYPELTFAVRPGERVETGGELYRVGPAG